MAELGNFYRLIPHLTPPTVISIVGGEGRVSAVIRGGREERRLYEVCSASICDTVYGV